MAALSSCRRPGVLRAIGDADLLIEKAHEIDQLKLRGISIARRLECKEA